MFKFGFQVNADEETTGSKDAFNTTETKPIAPTADEVSPYTCEELQLQNLDSAPVNPDCVSLFAPSEDVSVEYVNQFALLGEKFSDDVLTAESDHSDLIPNRYEGGLKVWECTFDLGRYMVEQNGQDRSFRGKAVLDLGCGAGVLGIVAAQLDATGVHFQDYNRDVLEKATMKNCVINGLTKTDVRYFAGDWESFTEKFDTIYDVILTSETIYSVANYRKLLQLFDRKLAPDGVVLLAAKTYYFGVGGGVRLFEQSLKDDGLFEHRTVWHCDTGVKREIIELKRRKKQHDNAT